jgi:ABC-type branched-subunit amino acid transport system ATPase component/sugar phosphate permease
MATTQRPRPRRRARGDAPDEAQSPETMIDQMAESDPAALLAALEHSDQTGQQVGGDGVDPDTFQVGGGEDEWSKLPLRQRLSLRNVVHPMPVAPLAILFGLNAVDELDRMAFSVLTPEIRDAFGLDLQGVLNISGFVLILNLLLEMPIGYLADRRNRVRLATGAAFFWGIFTILTGLSIVTTSLGLLYLARLGSALAKNLNTTHRSLLSDYYPLESRARVFYAHSFANNLGQIGGPLVAGALGALAGTSVPFFLLAVPTFLLVFWGATKLREPKRGVHERRAAGADEDTSELEEKPATMGETFRTLFASRSARRIYLSLPFITVSSIGLGSILSLFYEDVYNVGPFQRGLIVAIGEGMQIAGVLFGFVRVQRLMTKNPGRVMQMLAVAATFYAGCLLGVAASVNVYMAVFFQALGAGAAAILTPGILAVISLAIPPRMRSQGFATGSVFILMGAPFIFIVGGVGENVGLRWGLVVFIPVYLIGSFLLASSGAALNDDIGRIQLSARTQAEARRRRLSGDPTILTVRGLDVHYDQTQVLFNVDLDVQEGEILALLGTNGAGKSTLLKAISGINNRSAGVVIFDGEDITGADAMQTANLGIAQVPGGRGIFPSLTVAENIRAAGWMYRKDPEHLKESTARILEYFPVLEKRWETPSGALSGGEQQMLSLAQAFIAKPKLLMIDELSLGLAPTIVEKLLDIVRAIHANGTTIILVEQSVNVALRIAKRAVFMEKGEIRFEGPTAELLERTDILRAVFLKGAAAGEQVAVTGSEGATAGTHARRAAARALKQDLERRAALLDGPVVLEAEDLTKRYGGVTAVNGVSFQLHEGEVLGLIGPNGAGKTSIFDLLSGFQKVDGGRVILDGLDVTDLPAWRRAEHGLARSFQDARLWPALTVREAIATSMKKAADITNPLPAMFGLPAAKDSEADIEDRVEELIALLGLKAFRDKFVGELSTGSRRMVEFATLLSNDPKVIVLDEPSSGIAQKETEALGSVLKEIQRYTSSSILIIEHDMPLISGLADHIVALELGTVIDHGTPDEILNHPRVIESYLGNTTYNELQESGLASGSGAAPEGTKPRRRARSTE